jgi:hypothetical protein
MCVVFESGESQNLLRKQGVGLLGAAQYQAASEKRVAQMLLQMFLQM